ncbi:MAG: MFS transporter [Kibdelosporangium sp.]
MRISASPGTVVGVLASAGILAALMQTLVVPLIGELPRLLNTTPVDASWVITATLLSGAVATPVVGRLGDLYGKRRLLLCCIVSLVAGALLSAVATTVVPMIAGRVLQGVAMGIIPLGISSMRDVLPPERLGSSIALMSSSLGIGGAMGLPIAAAIAQNADWHMLFWGTAVLSTLIGVLVLLVVPPAKPSRSGSFDFAGAIGLAVGLSCLLLGVTKGTDWGWTDGTILGLLGGSIVLLGLWGIYELRISDPLIDLRTAARKQVLLTNITSVVVGFAMYAQALIVPQLLQLSSSTGYGLGQSMVQTGLWMAPSGLVMVLISPIGARLSARRGPRASLLLGAVIIAGGYLLILPLMGSTWGLLVFTCVSSVGIAFAYGAMPALIMDAVPVTETGAANGFNALMRAVGTSVASAVIGVVLAHMSTRSGAFTVPTQSGFQTAAIISAAVALTAAAVTLAIPRRSAAAVTGAGTGAVAGAMSGAGLSAPPGSDRVGRTPRSGMPPAGSAASSARRSEE